MIWERLLVLSVATAFILGGVYCIYVACVLFDRGGDGQ